MATRLTGRPRVLVPETDQPRAPRAPRDVRADGRASRSLPADRSTGQLDLDALRVTMAPDVAAVLVENPAYLGFIEEQAPAIAEAAHANGVAPRGRRSTPRRSVCSRRRRRYGRRHRRRRCPVARRSSTVRRRPGRASWRTAMTPSTSARTRRSSSAPCRSATAPAIGFAWTLPQSTSYDLRGDAQDYTGTSQWLWGIAAAVYLSLLGPTGMRELGEGLVARTAYLAATAGRGAGRSRPGRRSGARPRARRRGSTGPVGRSRRSTAASSSAASSAGATSRPTSRGWGRPRCTR